MSPTVPSADGQHWTDALSAIGTTATAVIALLALAATICLAQRDRKRADQDRVDAEQRLRQERDRSDEQIERGRAHAELLRLRERQQLHATLLLEHVADLQQHLHDLRSACPNNTTTNGEQWLPAARKCVEGLQTGARVNAVMLGDKTGAHLYRNLVRLAVAMLAGGSGDNPDRAAHDVRNYAKLVRLYLGGLVDGQQTPTVDVNDVPRLTRTPKEDNCVWYPEVQPAGWNDEATLDATDPQYRLAP